MNKRTKFWLSTFSNPHTQLARLNKSPHKFISAFIGFRVSRMISCYSSLSLATNTQTQTLSHNCALASSTIEKINQERYIKRL